MAGQNTLIISQDYNLIQDAVAIILGTGSGDYGYGRTVSSSQVALGNRVTVQQWSNLRTDLIRCRTHQTGTEPTLTIPTTATTIKESDRAAYKAVADAVTANRLTLNSTQATRENLITPAVRTAAWQSVTHVVTVDFGSYNDARYFFNTGSTFEFSASRTGGGTNLKNSSWTTLLQNAGTVSFGYTSTSSTGSGNISAIGFYDLTTSDQEIYYKSTEEPTYSPNKWSILARQGTNTGQVVFTIQFLDTTVPPASTPDPGFQIDEDVSGTLTSTVQVYRASGSYVSIPKPPASTNSIA